MGFGGCRKRKRFSYSKLDKKTLPKDLQNKSSEELKKHVTTQSKKRQEIQQKIKELNTKRNEYVAEKRKESQQSNGLESAMLRAIKRQAKTKDYVW